MEAEAVDSTQAYLVEAVAEAEVEEVVAVEKAVVENQLY